MVSDAMKVGINCNKCLNRGECKFYPGDNSPTSDRLSSTIENPVELEILIDDSIAKRLLFGDCNKLKEISPDKHHVVVDIGHLSATEVVEKVRDPGIETVIVPTADAQATKVIPEILVRVNKIFLGAGESGDI